MTNNNHPITPPPELLKRWREEAPRLRDCGVTREEWIATQAARWGADQELDACCEHLKRSMSPRATIDYLRAARRPKPPSLKEEALALLQVVEASDDAAISWDFDTIRRALESLPD